MRHFVTGIVALAILAVWAAVSPASMITWDAPGNISGPTDVSTEGTLVNAYSFGSLAATVNGVAFTTTLTQHGVTLSWTDGLNDVYDGFGYPSAGPSTGDTGYDTLLTSGNYNDGESGPVTVSYTGLTIGKTYAVEYWANDARGYDRSQVLSGTTDVTLYDDTVHGQGQFVIGTFTADTSSVSFTITQPAATANALELRDIPEPASMGLVIVGAGACMFRRQRG